MTQEQYISFETAKLLKEKGFDEECWCYYHNSRLEHYFREVSNRGWATSGNVAAPTQQMVMRWLREIHNIHIDIYVANDSSNDADGNVVEEWHYWTFAIMGLPCGNLIYDECVKFSSTEYQSYEEACEAAIRYCLEHLI